MLVRRRDVRLIAAVACRSQVLISLAASCSAGIAAGTCRPTMVSVS